MGGAVAASHSTAVRPLVADPSVGYASQLQYTLQCGAMDKNTGHRSPVTIEQGRGLCRMIENIDKRMRGEAVKPLRMLAAGGPGTGKSVLIDGFRDHAERCGWDVARRFRFSAPTGKAASLIGGNTLATFAGNKQYRPKVDKLRRHWGDVWLLIIDEVFMVDLTDMGIAWSNILKIIQDEDIDVVFVGDPLQFGPVAGRALFHSSFFINHDSKAARDVFKKQYQYADEWTSTMKAAWEFYRTFDPEETPGQGCVIWLDETKRTEGHQEWNEMMHLLRTFFRETLDGTVLDDAERYEKVTWVADALAKMVLGTPGRPVAAWQRPLLITPSRRYACTVGRQMLRRDGAQKGRRIVRYVSNEYVRGGEHDGQLLEKVSSVLYAKVGCEYSKKTNLAPREFVSFVGARMVIPQNSTDEVFKLNGWVNGCEGEVDDIVLDPREPADTKDDKGKFVGVYRELVYPPVYVVFKPFQHVPVPEIVDPKDANKKVAAGTFILVPKTFDFEVKVGMKKGGFAKKKKATTAAKKGEGAHVKLSLKRKEAFFLEQGYALTDLCSQGSTYDENVLVDVHKPLKSQSWYIALTRGKDPNKIALLSPLTLGTLLNFAGIGAATSTRSGATDDGDLGGGGGGNGKGGAEQADGGGGAESEPEVLVFAGDRQSTRRDVLSEVARVKRLAEMTRRTYPARSSVDSPIDGLRGVDADWYDEAARVRPAAANNDRVGEVEAAEGGGDETAAAVSDASGRRGTKRGRLAVGEDNGLGCGEEEDQHCCYVPRLARLPGCGKRKLGSKTTTCTCEARAGRCPATTPIASAVTFDSKWDDGDAEARETAARASRLESKTPDTSTTVDTAGCAEADNPHSMEEVDLRASLHRLRLGTKGLTLLPLRAKLAKALAAEGPPASRGKRSRTHSNGGKGMPKTKTRSAASSTPDAPALLPALPHKLFHDILAFGDAHEQPEQAQHEREQQEQEPREQRISNLAFGLFVSDSGGKYDSSSSSDPRSVEQLRRDAWAIAPSAMRGEYKATACDAMYMSAAAVPEGGGWGPQGQNIGTPMGMIQEDEWWGDDGWDSDRDACKGERCVGCGFCCEGVEICGGCVFCCAGVSCVDGCLHCEGE